MISEGETSDEEVCRKGSATMPKSLCLEAGEIGNFQVTFHPCTPEKCRGELSLRIQDNQFETLSLQLVGEGYQDDVSIENIHGGADRGQGGFTVVDGEDFQKLQPEEVEGVYNMILLCI